MASPTLVAAQSITGANSSGSSGVLNTGRQETNNLPTAPTRPGPQSWPGPATPIAGVALGGGRLFTGVTVATLYNDNMFAGKINRVYDAAFIAKPEFAWARQSDNLLLGVDGFLEGRRYAKYSTEDQLNGSFGSNFTYMPNSDTQIVGNARYIRAHVERGSSDTVGPDGSLLSTTFNKPIAYDQAVASLAFNKRFGQWWTSVGAAGVGVDYQAAPTAAGLVDLSHSEGVITQVNGRVGYVVAPQTSVFVEVAANSRNWKVDAFDSTGYRGAVGVLFEPGQGSRFRGEAWVGFMGQNFKGGSFEDISTWTFGANLGVGITDKLTGIVEAKREAKESALRLANLGPGLIGASDQACVDPTGAICVSTVATTVGGRLEYRLMPSLAFGIGASYMVDQYFGAQASDRSDNTLSPMAFVKYAPSDRVVFGLDWRRVNFDSSGGEVAGVTASSYYRDVYMLSMNGKF